jgi:DNA-binding transcriptional LysR family regulator
MGVQLLVPTERGIKLTPRGEELARALAMFDQSLYTLTSGLHEDTRRAEATVRVSITESLSAFLCSSGHRRLLAEKSEHSSAHEERDQLEQRARQSDRLMLAFAPDSRAGVVVKRLGSVHFHPTVFARLSRKIRLAHEKTILPSTNSCSRSSMNRGLGGLAGSCRARAHLPLLRQHFRLRNNGQTRSWDRSARYLYRGGTRCRAPGSRRSDFSTSVGNCAARATAFPSGPHRF